MEYFTKKKINQKRHMSDMIKSKTLQSYKMLINIPGIIYAKLLRHNFK